jgi:long-chain acyl-CoA synthetase
VNGHGTLRKASGFDTTINATLHDICLGDPEGPALRFKGGKVTKAGLYRSVHSAAAMLLGANIRHGDRVAMLAENSPEIMYFYFACARIGAVFIPLNANLTAADVSYIVTHSQAKLLLHDEALRQIAETAAPGLNRMPIGDLAQSANIGLDLAPEPPMGDFLIIYTSGTTGLPKAVVFDQAAEFGGNQALVEMWDMSPDDVTLVALPMGFLYGLSTAAATALQAGGEAVILPKFHPREVLEAIRDTNTTVFQGVPTMFAMMLQYAEQNGLDFDLSKMRLLVSAGAPLPDELRARFHAKFGKRIDDYYALTEVRPVFGKYASDPTEVPRNSLGKAAPGADIRIVDAHGTDVAVGTTGEVLVRAASTLDRYLENEVQTKAAFRDGFFTTGDLGYRDADGFYYLTGRIKDIIIRGGANIAPAEVEQALTSHPSVSSAAVFGMADAVFGEVPVGYVVLRPGHSFDAESIVEHCSGMLAAFKVPQTIRAIDKLPLGKTGKVDKAALLALWKASP